jgi:hypothetical protein
VRGAERVDGRRPTLPIACREWCSEARREYRSRARHSMTVENWIIDWFDSLTRTNLLPVTLGGLRVIVATS